MLEIENLSEIGGPRKMSRKQEPLQFDSTLTKPNFFKSDQTIRDLTYRTRAIASCGLHIL